MGHMLVHYIFTILLKGLMAKLGHFIYQLNDLLNLFIRSSVMRWLFAIIFSDENYGEKLAAIDKNSLTIFILTSWFHR